MSTCIRITTDLGREDHEKALKVLYMSRWG